MVPCYCKSILLGAFFGALICVEARPADDDVQTIRVHDNLNWPPTQVHNDALPIQVHDVARPTKVHSNANARNIQVPNKSDSAQIAEHRAAATAIEDDAPLKSLPFYGGAKGKYLLIHPSGRTSITHRNPSFYGIKGDDDDEEDVGMESEGGGEPDESESSNSTNGSGSGGPDESVSVGLPPDNASVAEAKPVGLAIAGPGGVASSRPVGTAVVGPGGLALAKPVATAIAGVQGSEQLVGLPGSKKRYDKPKISPATVAAAAAGGNKTRQNEENVVSGRSTGDDRFDILQYNSNDAAVAAPQAYNVFYIPLYLPAAPATDIN